MGTLNVTIPAGGTTSNGLNLGPNALGGIFVPAGFQGTSLTLLGSVDGTTYGTVQDKDGNVYTINVGAGLYIVLPPSDLAGLGFVKLVSNATEGSARALQLLVVGV